MRIDSFSGDWDFLSNFHDCLIEMDGVEYASVEHAYQAAKVLDPAKREVLTLAFNPRLHAGQAKRIGRNLKPLREGWDEIKRGIMKELLVKKFNQPRFQEKLLATGDAELVEGNWWHDTFFGVCMGVQNGHVCRFGPHEPVGENVLGQLLMEVRSEIRQQRGTSASEPTLVSQHASPPEE